MRNLLKENVVEITFKKVNGEIRVLNGTLIPDMLPTKTSTSSRNLNESIIRVFDIDKQEWRSFREDSVIEYKVID